MRGWWRSPGWAALGAGLAAIVMVVGPGRPAAEARAEAGARFHAQGMELAVVRGGTPYTVRLELLVDAATTPRDLAAIRAAYRARFAGASDAPVLLASTFALNGYTWPGDTVAWAYNAAGGPPGLRDDLPILRASAGAWNAAGSAFRFTGGEPTDAGTGACRGVADGTNTVGWGPQPGTTIGVTCTWYAGRTATEFDMELDPQWAWTTGGRTEIDLQSIATHEFGHALGLGHSERREAVMYGNYQIGSLTRELTGDDREAIIAVYGRAAAPPAPPPAELTLSRGSNLLTWPGDETPPAQALASVSAAIEVVYAIDPRSGAWQRYIPGAPPYVSNLPALHPGVSYWIIARGSATLPVTP